MASAIRSAHPAAGAAAHTIATARVAGALTRRARTSEQTQRTRKRA
jgi:hypothetical protein